MNWITMYTFKKYNSDGYSLWINNKTTRSEPMDLDTV